MLASTILRSLTGPQNGYYRSLHLLKRSHKLRQPQEGEAHKNINTRKMKTYELVKLTEMEKFEPLKVVLKELVEGYGTVGDVIEVRRNIGRFELILTGKAVYATPENLEWAKKCRESGEKIIRFSSNFSPATIRYLRGRLFALIMSEKTPWTLEKWHVRAQLRSQGLVVPEEALILPETPIHHNDDVFNKDIVITIKINGVDEARCRLRFRSSEILLDPATQLLEVEQPWYVEPSVALLESQAEEVEQLHKAVLEVFQQKIEEIKNEGLRSVTELNKRELF